MQMTKFVLCIAVALGLMGFADAAHAANWLMNGSQISVVENDNGALIMRYAKPRSELADYGVHQGTLLFRGTISDDNLIDGISYVFQKGCRPTPYRMSGSLNDAGTEITLYGAAPIFESDTSCTVVDYDSTGQYASMLLTNMTMMD
jgi:hypothetical protein